MKKDKRPEHMDETAIARNRLPPRAYYLPAQTLLLSGRWRFHLANHTKGPAPDSDDKDAWTTIDVPGHWQLQGFGHPQYLNFNYPIPVDPPRVPSRNPTGYYETTFAVPEDWQIRGGFEYRLRFDGVDSAFHLYVNGKEIGFTQGARTGTEFDISSVIKAGGSEINLLQVKVYKWSAGTYIEDQDMWWLSGIFRDVSLLAFPKQAYIEDFFVRTSFDDGFEKATLEIDISPRLDFAVELWLTLYDKNGKVVGSPSINELSPGNDTTTFALKVSKPLRWTAETPNLYSLKIKIAAGDLVFQEIEQKVGFRVIEIRKGLLLVNGVPIMIHGANLHEHHPRFGRAVPIDFIRHDLIQMKQHNMNAVRCAFFPNDPRFLSLTDELGLYVMDEADLECHGMFSDGNRLPSAVPSWRGAYVDRMQQLVHRDKNHPSVLYWSIGNEAYYGENLQAMYDWCKSYDKTRPVQYEGDHDFNASDICSYMYLSVDDLIKTAEQDGDDYEKPLILQEYVHAMGNGPGNVTEYIEAFRNHRRLQGGFVWEWANHGLLKPIGDGSGKSFYAYGGDFGDEPNDGNFISDGLCDSEHRPGPGLKEMKAAYAPLLFELVIDSDRVRISARNLWDFANLDALECTGIVRTVGPDDREVIQMTQPISLKGMRPSSKRTIATVQSEGWPSKIANTETWLTLTVRTATATNWAPVGHEIMSKDFCLSGNAKPQLPASRSLQNLQVLKTSSRALELKSPTCAFKFDLIDARMLRWDFQGQDVIFPGLGPQLTFWRAPTDNDNGGGGQAGDWKGQRIHQMEYDVRDVHHHVNPQTGVYEIITETWIAPPVLYWGFRTKIKYSFLRDGKLLISVNAKPEGYYSGTLPRIGFEFGLPKEFTKCEWFGLGPNQTYRDMKDAGNLGIWNQTVDTLNHMYEMPQETGNHTETRWVKVTNERGNGIKAILRHDDSDQTCMHDHSNNTERKSTHSRKRSSVSSALDNWEYVQKEMPDATKATPESTHEEQQQQRPIGFDFALSKYTAAELTRAQHPHELQESECVNFRIDAEHYGLGSASCGPDTLDKYQLKTREFNFSVCLEPIRG